MITDINYTDTLVAYTDYKMNLYNLPSKEWRKITPPKGSVNKFNHWYCSLRNIHLRYFPNLYGHSFLFITFSVPKVYNNSNNNTDHVRLFDSAVLDRNILNIISPHIDVSQLPKSILKWNVSRVDFFYNHIVPTAHKDDYLKAYSRLYMPRHIRSHYKSTSYLMSNLKKNRSASSVIRIYDKDSQMYEDGKNTIDNTYMYPDCVHEDVEELLSIEDDGFLLIPGSDSTKVRIEVQMRRRKIKYELKSKAANVGNVFNKSFQTAILNKYFTTLGLDRHILSQSNFRNKIRNIGIKKDSKRVNIMNSARLIRAGLVPYGGSNDIVRPTFNRYVKELKSHGIHIVTADHYDLIPIGPL